MTEDGQGMEPGGREAVVDQEHLRILWLGYWISAGATAFFGLLGLLYMAMGLVAGGTIPHNPALPQPPIEVGRFLGLLGAGFFTLSVAGVVMKIFAARCIRNGRARGYCLTIAALTCLEIPYGTALGVATFVVLGRDSVRSRFGRAPAGSAAGRRSWSPVAVVLVITVLAGLALAGTWAGAQALRARLAKAVAGRKVEGSLALDFIKYRDERPNKVMMVAFDDPEGRWIWCWRAGHVRMGEAIQLARKECDEARGKLGIAGPCRLYAVNSDVVVDYTDAALGELLARYRSLEGVGRSASE